MQHSVGRAGLHKAPSWTVASLPARPRPVVRRVQPVLAYAAGVAVPVRVTQAPREKAKLAPLPRALESIADDVSLHNPLQRMERLGTGWFGVIMEYEGVVVDDTYEWHARAWLQVAQEMGLQPPLGQMMHRIKGLRNEVAVSHVFHWTQNLTQARRISERKEQVYEELRGGMKVQEVEGSRSFLHMIRRNNIPIGLACALPERQVHASVQRLELESLFDKVITAEDSGAPEIEFYYAYAASQLQRPSARCVVVGSSNASVEAAHELGMKSVVVSRNQPPWHFASADLVVRDLSQLSFVNMKRLFGTEDLVEPPENVDDLPDSDGGLSLAQLQMERLL